MDRQVLPLQDSKVKLVYQLQCCSLYYGKSLQQIVVTSDLSVGLMTRLWQSQIHADVKMYSEMQA